MAKAIKHCFGEVLYGRGDTLVHCCRNSCCRSRKDAVQKAELAITSAILRLVPCTPLVSDWTKVGPALDFFMGSEFGGLLVKLLDAARADNWARPDAEPLDQDAELHEKLDWNRLAGRRLARTRAMLLSKQERFQRVLLSLAIEPLRHLHSRFLKHAHTAPDDTAWPLILNEIWPSSSKFVAAMEHLATLLATQSSRLLLLAQLSEERGIAEWVHQCPDEALQARSRFLMVAASLQRRYVARLQMASIV